MPHNQALPKRLGASRFAIAFHDAFGVEYDAGEELKALYDRLTDVFELFEHMEEQGYCEANASLIAEGLAPIAERTARELADNLAALIQPAPVRITKKKK